MPPTIHTNLSRKELTEWACRLEFDTKTTDKGALAVNSYHKKGRSPTDKRIVATDDVVNDVDWGKVNVKMPEEGFQLMKARAQRFLNRQEHLFVSNLFAGHDRTHRLKIRVITTRAYHAMFMQNMLIEPTPDELATYGEPDFTIYNAGECCADRTIPSVATETCVALNFKTREQVILGTQYAGEMKKGILTVIMYLETKRGNLVMHASANEDKKGGGVSVFFGLSGTGKTTLSADPDRALIGDDEHVWTQDGIFNVEGGCYAKAINLKEESEPDIFRAIRFGAVAENVVLNAKTGEIDFTDVTLTENTRVSYPLTYIQGAKIPAVGGHPKNVIFLTNDAYGVMPPVAKLTPAQAKFWFITGYTAKVAGTEVGVKDPEPTFSACFAGPFLVMHPTVYGDLLAKQMQAHKANVWLVNTGWSGGKFGTAGKRMSIKVTRAIVTAINNGTLAHQEFETMPGWDLQIPKSCPNVPTQVLNPINTWSSKEAYVTTIDHLAGLFAKNFKKYAKKASPDVLAAVPRPYSSSKTAAKL